MTVFGLIAANKTEHAGKTMCRVLGLSRSGPFTPEHRQPSRRTCHGVSVLALIDRIHEDSRRIYGGPRVHAESRLEHGIRVVRKCVERLMRDADLSGSRAVTAAARRSACATSGRRQ